MPTVREVLSARPHDPRRTRLRLQVYEALAAWPVESGRVVPTGRELAGAAGVRESQISTMFGERRPAVLPGGGPYRGTVLRAVAEAKEFTWEDYQRGWQEECDRLRLGTRQRWSALVHVHAAWVAAHPGLALLDDQRLPHGTDELLRDPVARGILGRLMREATVDVTEGAVTPGECEATAWGVLEDLPTPEDDGVVQATARVIGLLSDLVLHPDRDGVRAQTDLLIVLERAADVLRGARSPGR